MPFLFPFVTLILVILLTAGIKKWDKVRLQEAFILSGFHRAALIIAHPDDESMFFGPFLQACIRNGIYLDIYCLSEGTPGRCDELRRAIDAFNVKKKFLRVVACGPLLKDGFGEDWSPAGKLLSDYFDWNQYDLMVSFDGEGVSGHPNHTALSRAIDGLECGRKWKLSTLPIPWKYTSILPVFFIGNKASNAIRIVSSGREWVQCWRAMRKHASQLLWFRYLYLAFSSYLWSNEFIPED